MIIDSFEAEKILKAYQKRKASVKVKLDLGLNNQIAYFEGENIRIGDFTYTLKTIKKLEKAQAAFLLEKKPRKIAFFDECYYKLEPIKGTVPTIEIDGIRMHRTKHMTPLEDAERKIKYVAVKSSDIVLDICTGLGYTAIQASKRRAEVTTIEKDSNVLEIAGFNPYSRELFDGIEQGKIRLLNENAADSVKKFDNDSFSVILHDPPRFSFAGELYSEEFYEELYRIIKPKGRLLHYVGNPGSKYRGKDFVKGVQNRLNAVGFKTKKTPDGESVLGYK
ncbi:MAG: SAM-dependent methyltransferase [Candidatus Heimdallarchaeota archaeon]|nr:SAM-dependent methyltransferase [Candidatus Heimdallarchaeota archaeon]MCK4254400.1 SAM-dependent methyltransferase [Candidatus Heimdallarchaeota archaeon]